jgi:hypothetical protein
MKNKRQTQNTKAPYGYRRVWSVPYPPQVGTKSPLYREMKRMHRAGPNLQSLEPVPARLSALGCNFVKNWNGAQCSNWDLYPASILIVVAPELGDSLPGLRFSSAHGCITGEHTGPLGVHFSIQALVTRGGHDRHKEQLRQLAAALRDTATLLERACNT